MLERGESGFSESRRRASAAALAIAVLQCNGPPATRSVATNQGSTAKILRAEARQVSDATESTGPEVAEVSPDASDGDSAADADIASVPGWNAYNAQVQRECPQKEGPGTTWGMVAATEALLNCHAKLIAKGMAKLPPPARGALLDGDRASPRALDPRPEGSLWASTIDALCRFQDARIWIHGDTLMAGSLEHNTIRWCIQAPQFRLGFLVEAWLANNPDDAARFAESESAAGREIRRVAPVWQRYAEKARKTAPHEALARGPGADIWRFSDADWLMLEADVDLGVRGSTKLAQALCAEWPALAQKMGGAAPCADKLALHMLATAWGDVNPERASPDPTDPNLGHEPIDAWRRPPADDRYLDAVRALRLRCLRSDSPAGCLRAERLAAEGVSALSQRAGFANFSQRMDAFVADLCATDAAQYGWRWNDKANGPDVSGIEPDGDCLATADLLRTYAMWTLALSRDQEFMQHVRARQDWGRRVETSLSAMVTPLEQPCPTSPPAPTGPFPPTKCSPTSRGTAARRLRATAGSARDLAVEMCGLFPELATDFAPGDCVNAVRLYWLSYAGKAYPGSLALPF